MTTAIDTNVLIALWDRDPYIRSAAQKGLETAFRRGGLAIAALRRKQRDSGTRRILADFMIGAHAEARGYRLLTLDEGVYRTASPKLVIETVQRPKAAHREHSSGHFILIS